MSAKEVAAFTNNRDISPDNELELIASPGGATAETNGKPKPKSLFSKIASTLKLDPSLKTLHKEKETIAIVATEKQAELDRQIAEKESEIATAVREHDPHLRAQRKQAEALLKGRMLQARRLGKLIEMVDEANRRSPCKDQELLDWCYAQLQNYHLFGLLSRPGKDK